MGLGDVFWKKHSQYEEAEKIVLEGICCNPESENLWAQLGYIRHRLIKNLEGAEVAIRKCLEFHPGWSNAWFELSEVLEELGRPEEAAEALRKSEELFESDGGPEQGGKAA